MQSFFWVSCLSNKSLSYFASVLRQFSMILSPNKKWRKIFFLLLSKTLELRINSCYSLLFSNLKQKKNVILLVEILAVTWVPCILRHPIYIHILSKVGVLSWGWPNGSLFNSYKTEVLRRVLLHSLDCSTLPLILTL